MKEERRNIGENEKLILHGEVEGVCPICSSRLMYEKNGRNLKGFEIAHIYPLNPLPHEIDLLINEEKLNSDLDHRDNLICLCVDCHKRYDKFKTIDEYRSLVTKKKRLVKRNKEKEIWTNTRIENEILEIIDLLAEKEYEYRDIIEYNPKTINNKVDKTITHLTKRKIHINVRDFFYLINQKFKEIDYLEPNTSEIISAQIKTHYLLLKKQENNQRIIFDALVNWLKSQTNQEQNEPSEIIISYFIQNCEVF